MLDHHTRKSGGKTEDLIRGGTALPGAVENIVSIAPRGKDESWETRRRTLHSRGRVKDTLWTRTIELDEAGTDYVLRSDYRLEALAQRDEWTAADFAKTIGKSIDVARRYLNSSTHVERVEPGGRGGNGGGASATVFRVLDRQAILRDLDVPI